MGDLIVLKFGSSVLRAIADLPVAVHEIYRWYRAGWRVIAVVSAIGNATEQLLSEAHDLTAEPAPNGIAELLATGERRSAALMAVALDRAGLPARSVDPLEIQLTAEGDALDSDLVHVDRERMAALLSEYPIIVVPGFFGYSRSGRLQLLGHGGSDLTAVFLAHELGTSRCRQITEVDGVYDCDPIRESSAPARRFAALGYEEAIERAARLVQPKALRHLQRHRANAEVAGIASCYETVIGPYASALDKRCATAPLSVVLLGLGTVGFGVYQRIAALPNHFRIVGVLIRERLKHIARGIPSDQLHESVKDLANIRPDVVVDLLPDVALSRAVVEHSLARSINVVSANKALIADAGSDLMLLASRHGVSLSYSAAVGGSTPMLEALHREGQSGQVRCIAGILNGTCNYVLDRCAEGLLFNEAVRVAQGHGFAEADASEDLAGRDAGRKLRILVRHAFGQELTGLVIEPLNAASILRARMALHANETLRVIARAWKLGSRVLGQVRLEAVATEDAFAHVSGEWNRLVVTRADGTDLVVCGRGAGRWPTTEAVVADLLELWLRRSHAARQ